MNAMNSLSGGGEKQYGSSAELCALLGGKFVLNAVCLPSWSK